MPIAPTTGVHHITLNGADRQTSIDFWQGTLGMPFVFEQPNLDDPDTNHLYFDPGDGRLITIFTRENLPLDPSPNPNGIGNLHHLAFSVDRAVFDTAVDKLKDARFASSGEIDRGFMDSIYFRDPLGQLIELACYKFTAPEGVSHSEVLALAHKIRVAADDYNITVKHLSEACEQLAKTT